MSTALLWLRQAPVYALSAAQILMDVGPLNRTALADSALSEKAGEYAAWGVGPGSEIPLD